MDQMQWLRNLYQLWQQNKAQAVLQARLDFRMIDQRVLACVVQWSQSAGAYIDLHEEVDIWAGSLGLGGSPNYGMQSESYDLVFFCQVIVSIARGQGDPPASQALQARALDILQGRFPAFKVLELCTADDPRLQALLGMVGPFIMSDPTMQSVIGQTGIVVAALALPRAQLLKLAGVKGDVSRGAGTSKKARREAAAQNARKAFSESITAAEKAGTHDFRKAEHWLLKALGQAAQSPEPDDDILALQHLIALFSRGGATLEPETVRRCVRTVAGLVRQGHRGTAVSNIVCVFDPIVAAGGLSQELDSTLAEAGDKLLEGDMEKAERVGLTASNATVWLRLGRTDSALARLEECKKLSLTASEGLEIARVEAKVRWVNQDRDGAADALIAALSGKKKAEPVERLTAMEQLILLWPDTKDGKEGWLEQFEEELNATGGLARDLGLVSLATALIKSGDKERALPIAKRANLKTVRDAVPPHLIHLLDELEEQLGEVVDTV